MSGTGIGAGSARTQAKPRSASAGKKGKGGAQGGPLPVDRSRIEIYPVGCCVLIDVDRTGEASWQMIVFRIGGEGAPHCARMMVDPSEEGWNAGLRGSREIPASTIVLRSCWPLRRSSESGRGGEQDPLAGDAVDGALMLSHLSSDRGSSTEGKEP